MRFFTTLLMVPVMASAVTGTGQQQIVSGDTSTACIIAELKAFKDVAQKVGNVDVSTQYNHSCTDTISKHNAYQCLTTATTDLYYNNVITKVLSKKVATSNDTCTVTIEADTKQATFVNANVTGKQDYLHGEKIHYTVSVSEPMYLYVFVKHNNHMELVYPETNQSSNKITGTKSFPFSGREFYALAENGKYRDSKDYVFLLTRNKHRFNNHMMLKYKYEDVVSHIPSSSKRVFYKTVYIAR